MNEIGYIQCLNRYVTTGDYTESIPVDFKWIGPPIAKVFRDFFDELYENKKSNGDIISIGPFQMQVIEYNPEGFYLVRRIDKNRYIARLYEINFRIRNILRIIETKTILTLAIWNLADWPRGEIPNWELVKRRWRK